jgi:protein crumbs
VHVVVVYAANVTLPLGARRAMGRAHDVATPHGNTANPPLAAMEPYAELAVVASWHAASSCAVCTGSAWLTPDDVYSSSHTVPLATRCTTTPVGDSGAGNAPGRVAVGVGVLLGVPVVDGVWLGVPLGDGVLLGVPDPDAVPLADAVPVPLGDGVGLGVPVGDGVGVVVAAEVLVVDGDAPTVPLADTLAVLLGVAVALTEAVDDGDGVTDAVAVGVAVGVRVLVGGAVDDGVLVGVAVCDGTAGASMTPRYPKMGDSAVDSSV